MYFYFWRLSWIQIRNCGIIDNVFHSTSSPFGSIHLSRWRFLPGGIGPCKTNNSLSRTILPGCQTSSELENLEYQNIVLKIWQIQLWKIGQITHYQEADWNRLDIEIQSSKRQYLWQTYKFMITAKGNYHCFGMEFEM